MWEQDKVASAFGFPELAVTKIYRYSLTAAAVMAVLGSARVDAAADKSPWYTEDAFRMQLDSPATVFLTDSPLRQYLVEFGRAQHIAVLLDRRVDPEQKLELNLRDVPVLTVLQAVATGRNLRVVVLRNVIYVGLPEDAGRLRTVVELRCQEVAAMGAEPARRFARLAPIVWQDLDEPRKVLEQLAGENGIEIVNPERVPHDLWAACDLPPMSVIERLTLILHQFGLTFQLAPDARRIAVVPVSPDVAVVRDYPGGADPEALAERWRARLPRCEIRVANHRVYVRGLVEDIETIETVATPAGHRSAKPAREPDSDRSPEQVFTAEVPNRPLGVVLAHFAKQLGLELEIDQASLEKAGVTLDRTISFRVQEATFDELFRAVLSPLGCTYERRGKVLRIWAKP